MPPVDGVPPRRLNLLLVGSLVGTSLPDQVPNSTDVDVVVATGGLTDSALGTLRWLRTTVPQPIPIILVLGPRELQGGDPEVTLRKARRLAAARGITLLDDAEAVVRGVRFVGGTLWTDFRLHGTDTATLGAALDAAKPTFDRLGICPDGQRLTPLASTGLHWRTRSWLGLNLPGAVPTIVVTHHAPTGSGLSSSLCIDPLAASRASRCDDLVRQSQALLWVHGGYDPVDHVVGGTRVVSRPILNSSPGIMTVEVSSDKVSDLRGRPRLNLLGQLRPGQSRTATVTRTLFQADLFGVEEARGPDPWTACTKPAPHARGRAAMLPREETAARLLDAHADYRVLRRVKPRPVDVTYRPGPGERIALLVDVETTGLDHRIDEVTEIGMVAFVHDAEGRIGPVVGVIGMLQEPTREISPEITRLTGITPGMVAGKVIDLATVRALVERADLVIAHNASFDRAFCERLDDAFRHKAWACSMAEVPWRDIGFEGAKLGYIVNGCGLFHNGHRAVDDCHALMEVLAHEVGGATAFSRLLCSSRRTRVRIWAERSPFEKKDVLKARGYRWSGGGDGRPKAWWTEVDEENLKAELHFLEREVYLREVDPRHDVLTAYDRYRAL